MASRSTEEFIPVHHDTDWGKISRRGFVALGGAAIVGGSVKFLLGGSGDIVNESNPSDSRVVEGYDQGDIEATTEEESTTAQDIIKIEDLPRDESLYAGLISPEEAIDTLENGTEEDIRALFGVPVEKVLVNGKLNMDLACRLVFEKIGLGLLVGFDPNSLKDEKTGGLLSRGRYIEKATAHDERIAQIIGGYSEQDLISGKVGKKFLTRYYKGGHIKALNRFYDSANATDENLRSLNETIRVDTLDVRPQMMSGVDYAVATTFEITNVMNIEHPPLSPISGAKGDMILWADVEGSNVQYNLSPMSATEEITPFDKISNY